MKEGYNSARKDSAAPITFYVDAYGIIFRTLHDNILQQMLEMIDNLRVNCDDTVGHFHSLNRRLTYKILE